MTTKIATTRRLRPLGFAPALLLLAGLALAAPAGAVLIASGDGSGNTQAPGDDPGFAHVGTVGSLSAVYLGGGWVISAAHVGPGEVVLQGRAFAPEPGSEVALVNRDGTPADLVAWRLIGDPSLPSIGVASQSPAVGSAVLMAGHGRNRGDATEWLGRPGFAWGEGHALRWGTNEVSETGADVVTGPHTTRSFYPDGRLAAPADAEAGVAAAPKHGDHEAQATPGDSGGAVFVREDGAWKLAGVMIAVLAPFQPDGLSLAGNLTYAADLAFYREQLDEAGALAADGAPSLSVARRLGFGWVRVGRTREARLQITNAGDAPLHLHAVELRGSPHFAIEPGGPHPLELAPGGASRLPVRFRPARRGWHTATLELHSDDPQRPVVEVRLYGLAWGGHRLSWRFAR